MYKLITILLLICPTLVFADCVKEGNCVKNDDSTMTCTCNDPVVNNIDINVLSLQIDELNKRIVEYQNKIVDLQAQIEIAKKIGVNSILKGGG